MCRSPRSGGEGSAASRSRAWGPAWVPGSPPAFRVVSRASASLGDRRSHRVFFDSSAARSSSATRASISSISLALPQRFPARLPIGLVELGFLHPSQQRVDPNTRRAGSFLHAAVRQQGRDGLLLLASEFGAVSYPSAPYAPTGARPSTSSPFLRPGRFISKTPLLSGASE